MRRGRPTFNQLIVGLKPEDGIVIKKLDRCPRNIREALEIVNFLLDNNLTINEYTYLLMTNEIFYLCRSLLYS